MREPRIAGRSTLIALLLFLLGAQFSGVAAAIEYLAGGCWTFKALFDWFEWAEGK